MNIHLPKTRLEIWNETDDAYLRCGLITEKVHARHLVFNKRLYEMWGKRLDEKDRSKKC